VAYADLALLLARRLGVASSLVTMGIRNVPGGAVEGQGPHTVLDTGRTRTEFGFQPAEPEEILAGCLAGEPA
jgi:hypothetical protein